MGDESCFHANLHVRPVTWVLTDKKFVDRQIPLENRQRGRNEDDDHCDLIAKIGSPS